MWKDVLWISAGAILGANLRYAVGRLLLVIEFIDSAAKVEGVMPELKRMVGDRLIVRSGVDVERSDAGNN